ncbi:MAG: hypothetical protein KAS36_01560 [Anaerolineales bacterium]|nr:hypothetical protein [Anaerolineales bacterium]
MESLNAIVMRLMDTDDFLNLFIRDGGIAVTPDNLSEFLVRGLMAAVCNQSAIMTYLLEKEGHPGLPGSTVVVSGKSDDDDEEAT